ncbi:unnamed protein product [Closterium sp. Naga37s-1]|nr:unnamed protein product [Closterium sp. Naga37s-1]
MAAAVADLTVTAENVGASGESKVLQAIRHAIKDMVVRGAPAIAIAAALALAVEVHQHSVFESADAAVKHITDRLDYLVSSRPTAVNLSDAAEKIKQDHMRSRVPLDAAEKLKRVAEEAAKEEPTPEAVVLVSRGSAGELRRSLAAEAMLSDDVALRFDLTLHLPAGLPTTPLGQPTPRAHPPPTTGNKTIPILNHPHPEPSPSRPPFLPRTATPLLAMDSAGVMTSLPRAGPVGNNGGRAHTTRARPSHLLPSTPHFLAHSGPRHGSRRHSLPPRPGLSPHMHFPALTPTPSLTTLAAWPLQSAAYLWHSTGSGSFPTCAGNNSWPLQPTATALGVIRPLHVQGLLETALCTDDIRYPVFSLFPSLSQPCNSTAYGTALGGSRLTAFELTHDGIPRLLIADSAAASLKAAGRIDAVVAPQDALLCVCAADPLSTPHLSNPHLSTQPLGDTANKIGTYSLALSAFHHKTPFFVAAPLTSIDAAIKTGEEIVVEERHSAELTHSLGGAGPQGVIWKKEGASVFDIRGFLHSLGAPVPSSPMYPPPANNPHTKEDDAHPHTDPHKDRIRKDALEASRFTPVSEHTVPAFLQDHPDLAARLGGGPAEWSVREVGDGNINFVYIVEGPGGALVVKQALPYVRVVGESWPMTLDRIYYEALALRQQFAWVPELVPEVYFFSHPMALLVMRYVAPPAIVLRKGLVQGRVYPRLAEHMSSFLASTLFLSSLIAINTEVYRDKVREFCGNVEMCRLTEQVIFTEPYVLATNNRWTTPQLDADAAALREDVPLKLAITELKSKFCERAQALLHADLHTGSVMVTEESTVVIDPEFAFYGPMGFDIGAFLGNLLLAYFSQDGHATADDSRAAAKKWLLQCVTETWQKFEAKFLALWNDKALAKGDAYPQALYHDNAALLSAAQTAFLREVFLDSLGFAGAKMIRRIVGIAHVEDLESIADPDVRAACERRALNFGKHLVKERHQFKSIADVAAAVEAIV